MPHYGVIADDLTGAMDAGVQMLRRAAGVRVSLSETCTFFHPHGICMLTSNSRNRSPAQARSAVIGAAEQIRQSGAQLLYKKVDSTLRGNVGAEIEALIAHCGYEAVLLCPALPKGGRTTVKGMHYVNGVPLARSDLAKDPLAPVASSDIAAIVRAQTKLPCALLSLDDVRGGALAARMAESLASGARILIADAQTDADLYALACALRPFGGRVLAAGSAGLFAYVDRFADIAPPTAQVATLSAAAPPVLILSGSPAKRNIEQTAHLAQHRPDVLALRPDLSRLSTSAWIDEVRRIVHAAQQGLGSGRSVLVDAATMEKAALGRMFAGQPDRLAQGGMDIQRLLSAAACAAVAARLPGSLWLLGGDSAWGVLCALGAESLELVEEPLPLIPLARIRGGAADGLCVLTKAGGFGEPDALIRLFHNDDRKG